NTLTRTTEYTIAVGMQAPARIFLRHPRAAGYDAKGLPPGAETAPDLYLVPIPIAAGKTSKIAIDETRAVRQELAILATGGARLGEYLAGSKLAAGVEKQVREVVSLRTDLGKAEADSEELRGRLEDIGQRSAELRESLRSIE